MVRVSPEPEPIHRVLAESGWLCHRISEDTFRGTFQGRSSAFPYLVRLDPAGFIVFAIVPYLRSPDAADLCDALYLRLLQLNQEFMMAKFSIDDDLDIVLSVEYALAELDRSEIHDALNALSYYADRHYDELKKMSMGSTTVPAMPAMKHTSADATIQDPPRSSASLEDSSLRMVASPGAASSIANVSLADTDFKARG